MEHNSVQIIYTINSNSTTNSGNFEKFQFQFRNWSWIAATIPTGIGPNPAWGTNRVVMASPCNGIINSYLWTYRAWLSVFHAYVKLLNTINCEIDSAGVVRVAWTQRVIGGRASCWQFLWNDPSYKNYESNSSLQTTCTARIKCMASLSWQHTVMSACPILLSKHRSMFLPWEWLGDQKVPKVVLSRLNASFCSKAELLHPDHVHFSCVYQLKNSAVSSSLLISSMNATSSANAIPWKQESYSSLVFWGSMPSSVVVMVLCIDGNHVPCGELGQQTVSPTSRAHLLTFISTL